jgi:hypothetical protein
VEKLKSKLNRMNLNTGCTVKGFYVYKFRASDNLVKYTLSAEEYQSPEMLVEDAAAWLANA